MSAKAVVRMPGEGKQVSLAGKPLVFLVTGQDTKHTSMFDWTLPAGFSTGTHVHRVQEETFYVLEGECEFVEVLKGPAPMPPEGCPAPHHAEVVACDVFATPNSLKSRVARKVLSPFSNIHAVTPKLRTHSTSTAIENQWTSNFACSAQFPKEPAAPLVPHFPRFGAWRFSAAGRFSAGRVSLLPAAENLHRSGREQTQQTASYSITSSARASSVGGNCQADRLRRLEVDCQLILRRRLHRQSPRASHP